MFQIKMLNILYCKYNLLIAVYLSIRTEMFGFFILVYILYQMRIWRKRKTHQTLLYFAPDIGGYCLDSVLMVTMQVRILQSSQNQFEEGVRESKDCFSCK